MANCESPIEQIMALRLNEYKNSWKAISDYYRPWNRYSRNI